ncbi:FAD-dependent oxidoreductase [Verrucomicrobia bacterium]|nr:FAD-dependent oxidoreductase [Verrucomicrobiota bacterium]MDC0324212.1 FAD-dependent oxidoreductase [Verrucomicrobiota bacterium]MDG1857355.1 FAD-dependent oxidoreductase [Verrucomicrobiota bacterium]
MVGGTPAGIVAAKSDKKVIILEQSSVLDGVLSSVVIRLDDYYLASNSGVIESFRERVREYHRSEPANDPMVRAHLKTPIARKKQTASRYLISLRWSGTFQC